MLPNLRTFLASATLLMIAISAVGQFQVGGTATDLNGGCYRLTVASGNQAGYVYQQTTLNLNDSFDFSFQVNLGSNDGGADGIVFVLRGDLNGSLIGSPGGSLGYNGSGFSSNSLGIEIDTWDNGVAQGEIGPDHLGIQRNGVTNHTSNDALAGPIQASITSVNIEDGADHTFRVRWDGVNDTLQVYFDCALRLTLGIDLISEVFNGDSLVNWGFLGTTGGASNIQSFCIPTPIDSLTNPLTDVVLCPGDSVQLNAGDDRVDYLWSPSAGVSDSTLHDPWFTPMDSTTYIVRHAFACDTTYDTVHIDVDTFEFELGSDTGICAPDFTINGPTNAINYVWSNGANTSNITVDSSGTYILIASTGACADTDSISVVISYTDFPDDTVLCTDSVRVGVSPGSGTVFWNTTDTTDSISIQSVGLYWVSLSNAFCSLSDSFMVDFRQVEVSIPEDTAFCGNTELSAVASDATSYLWSNGDTNNSIVLTTSDTVWVVASNAFCAASDTAIYVLERFDLPESALLFCSEPVRSITAPGPLSRSYQWSTGSNTQTIQVDESGTYTVTVTSPSCTFSDSVFVVVSSIPSFDLGSDITICQGQTTGLNTALEMASIRWSTGDTGQVLLVSDTGLIWAEANRNGCTFRDSIYITNRSVDPDRFYQVPNAITPNGDGINDVFRLEVQDASIVRSVEYSIYNRWGTAVHHGSFLNDGWDGFLPGGGEASAGTYFYVVQAQTICLDIPVIEVKDHITLFR